MNGTRSERPIECFNSRTSVRVRTIKIARVYAAHLSRLPRVHGTLYSAPRIIVARGRDAAAAHVRPMNINFGVNSSPFYAALSRAHVHISRGGRNEIAPWCRGFYFFRI